MPVTVRDKTKIKDNWKNIPDHALPELQEFLLVLDEEVGALKQKFTKLEIAVAEQAEFQKAQGILCNDLLTRIKNLEVKT